MTKRSETPAAVSLSKSLERRGARDTREDAAFPLIPFLKDDRTSGQPSPPPHTQLCVGRSTQQNEMSRSLCVCVCARTHTCQPGVTVLADSAFLCRPSFQSFHRRFLRAATCHRFPLGRFQTQDPAFCLFTFLFFLFFVSFTTDGKLFLLAELWPTKHNKT